MVALVGVEPTLPKEPDFESSVYTNFTTTPKYGIASTEVTSQNKCI